MTKVENKNLFQLSTLVFDFNFLLSKFSLINFSFQHFSVSAFDFG
jgi:hypothetical protein